MTPWTWGIVGAALGAATVAPAAFLSRRGAALSVLVAVVAMNWIYVGVALPGPAGVLLGETALALVMTGCAMAPYRARSGWIAACVLAHAGVDAAHHLIDAAPVPGWYLAACVGYDVVYAALATWVLRRAA